MPQINSKMMIAAINPVAVCFLLSVSPQCGQVAAFGETCRAHVLQLINFVTDYPPGAILPPFVTDVVTDVMSGAA